MKMVLLAMVTCLMLDLLIWGYFFNVWLMPVATLGLAALLYLGYRFLSQKKPNNPDVQGWRLGTGLDISNPEKSQKANDIVLEQSILDLGLLVVGSPRSGKTLSSGIGFMHYLNTEVVDIGFAWHDGKGDKDIYQSAVAAGIHFDFFFSSELKHSNTMNAFEGDASDVIDRSIRVLINETTGDGQYYSDEQRRALTLIVRLLKALPEKTNYRDLFVALSVASAGEELLTRVKKTELDKVDIQLAENWIKEDWRQRINRISGLLNRLFLFVSGGVADRINDYDPDICLATALEKKQKLYFHLPLTNLSRDMGILLTEMWGVEARKRQQAGVRNTYPLMFDDWGGFFHDYVGPITARIRSAKMPPSYSFQDDSYLEEVSPEFKKQLENNIAIKIAFRTSGVDAAKSAAQWFGQYRSHQYSESHYIQGAGNSMSTGLAPRLMHDDLLALSAGEGFVMTLNERFGYTQPGYYKVQFPLIALKDPEHIDWPTSRKVNDPSMGLNFWDRYMNPDVIEKIRKEMKTSLLRTLEDEVA